MERNIRYSSFKGFGLSLLTALCAVAVGNGAVVSDAHAQDPGPGGQSTPPGRGVFDFYIAPGGISSRVDPEGYSYTVRYDDEGRAIRHTDELGREVKSEYDSIGRVIKRTYPEGNSSQMVYDQYSNVIQMTRTSKDGSQTLTASATYHTTWQAPTSVTDFRGHVVNLSYYENGPGAGQIKEALQPADVNGVRPRWQFEYGPEGRAIKTIDPLGLISESVYAANGDMLSSTIDPAGVAINIQYTSYSPFGDVLAMDGPRSDVNDAVSMSFDPLRRPVIETDTLGQKTVHLYRADGIEYKTCVQAEPGPVPGDAVTSCEAATTATAYWSISEGTFNLAGEALSATDPSGFVTQTSYDGKGRTIVVRDAEGRMTRTVYDALDRPTKIIRAWAGNLDGTGATIDCNVMRAASEADPVNNLQQCYQHYSYTQNGQVETVTDAGGNVTRYVYDGFDRLQLTLFPHKETKGQVDATDYERYTYDDNGNMTEKRARDG